MLIKASQQTALPLAASLKGTFNVSLESSFTAKKVGVSFQGMESSSTLTPPTPHNDSKQH